MMDTPENVDMVFNWETRSKGTLRENESEKTSKKS